MNNLGPKLRDVAKAGSLGELDHYIVEIGGKIYRVPGSINITPLNNEIARAKAAEQNLQTDTQELKNKTQGLDETGALVSDLNVNGKKLKNVADPVDDQDGANKRWTLMQTSGNGSPKGVAYLSTSPIANPVAGDWYWTAENGDYTNFGVTGVTAAGRLIYDGTNWVFVNANLLSEGLIFASLYDSLASLQDKINNLPDTLPKLLIIDKNIDLGNGILTIKPLTSIFGTGGCFFNGEIVGDNTILINTISKVFETNAFTSGTWIADKIYPEQFGAIGDGVTNDAFAFQHAANCVTQTSCRAVFQMLGKTYLLNPGSDSSNSNGRIFLKTNNISETFIIRGISKNKTFIKNTQQTWAGDLLSSVRAGSKDWTTGKEWYAGDKTNGEGSFDFRDFTILGTFQGATDGTGGCNPIGIVAPKQLFVTNVDIINSGNRAIAFETDGAGDGCELLEIKNVKIKNTWKNAISINEMSTNGGTIKIENVEIDGFNLVANSGGTYVDNNTAINIYSNDAFNTLLIKNVQFKNGYAQLIYSRLQNEIRLFDIEIENIDVIDASTSINQYLIFISDIDADTFEIRNLSCKNVVLEGPENWLLSGHLAGALIDNIKLENAYGMLKPTTWVGALIKNVFAKDVKAILNSNLDNFYLFNLTVNNAELSVDGGLPNVYASPVSNFIDYSKFDYTDKLIFDFTKEIASPTLLPAGWYPVIYSAMLPFTSVFLQLGVGLRILQSGAPSSKNCMVTKKINLDTTKNYQIRAKLSELRSGAGVRVYLNSTEELYLTDLTEQTSGSITPSEIQNLLQLGGTAFNGDYTFEYVIVEIV